MCENRSVVHFWSEIGFIMGIAWCLLLLFSNGMEASNLRATRAHAVSAFLFDYRDSSAGTGSCYFTIDVVSKILRIFEWFRIFVNFEYSKFEYIGKDCFSECINSNTFERRNFLNTPNGMHSKSAIF